MKQSKLPWILCAFLAVPAVAQTVIKGHHLGETPQQFLQADPAMKKKLQDCHAAEPKAISADQLQSMSKQEFEALQRTLGAFAGRKQLESLAKKGQLFTPDQRFPAQHAFCDSVINALEKGSQIPFTDDIPYPELNLPETLWFFGGGQLMEIVVDFKGTEFSDVESDLVKRIGAFPKESTAGMSNAYGARWNAQIATWLTPELFAKLVNDPNPAKPELELTVTARWLFDARAKSHDATPSPLD